MDNPLFRFDPGIFLWTWIAFGILVVVLGKFAFAPILQALQDREQLIESSITHAREIEKKYAQVQQDISMLLQKSEDEAMKILELSKQNAKAVALEIESQARMQADAFLKNMHKDIQQQRELFLQQMSAQVLNLSLSISKKVLSQQLLDEQRANAFLSQSLREGLHV